MGRAYWPTAYCAAVAKVSTLNKRAHHNSLLQRLVITHIGLSVFIANMPTVDHFNKYPPFPASVPIADLRCLSFSKLLADEESESERLFQSCRETGFFLVDLRGTTEGETMLKHAEIAFDLNKKIFELDQEELNKHALQHSVSLFGFVLLRSL